MEGADRHDGVVLGIRQRVLQYVSENTRDIGRHYLLGLVDHGRGTVEGIDVCSSLGQFHSESPCTAADVKHPATWPGQVAQEQAVVIGVVIPGQRVHAPQLCCARGDRCAPDRAETETAMVSLRRGPRAPGWTPPAGQGGRMAEVEASRAGT